MEVSGQDGPVTVLIADHRGLFREGLTALLRSEPDLRVVAEAEDGDEVVKRSGELSPDVILLDIEFTGLDASEVVQRLRRASPTASLIVLTTRDDPSLVRDLLDLGIAAYLTKSITRDELVTSIRAVARGQGNVLLSVSRETIEALDKPPPCVGLSRRELEVLQLAARAESNAQIARTLLITEGTVKRHLTNAYAKLHAVSRVDAIRKATAARLFPPTDE